MRKAKDLVPREADRLGTVQGHRDGFGFVFPMMVVRIFFYLKEKCHASCTAIE